MPRTQSSFNPSIGGKTHARNFTHVEPKGAYDATESWWAVKDRETFMQRRDAELPRMLKTSAMNPTAESGKSARQSFVARKVASMFDRVRGGAE